MKSKSSVTLGLPAAWEDEALIILNRYERRFAHRLPELELRSRALRKLARANIKSRSHLGPLLCTIVHQVLINYGKEQSRHYKYHVYDYACDWPFTESGLPPAAQDRLHELFEPTSPLDASEKELLQLMLEDPVHFMRNDGCPEQRALGRHLNVAHTTVGRRWGRIIEKVAAW